MLRPEDVAHVVTDACDPEAASFCERSFAAAGAEAVRPIFRHIIMEVITCLRASV